LAPARVEVAAGIWLDSRLALVSPGAGWLAISDVHYGYEVSLRKTGYLFPDYGREDMEARLDALLLDYQPATLIFVGDMVHDYHGVREFLGWLEELRDRVPRVVLIRGNHDRYLSDCLGGLEDFHLDGAHFFHHGHEETWKGRGEIEITGHWHPAIVVSDGAGTSIRAPAFWREPRPGGGERWVLPAFSPWTGGTIYQRTPGDQLWMCHPRRILPV
jgi:putative SbcD/Mre11-related phosphoesterase